jgi:acetylornithine/N-succinyldiaminopimelate aminotransferase
LYINIPFSKKMEKTTQEIIDLSEGSIASTYARRKIALKEGKGVRVTDYDGKSYLDFAAGIAVNSLGHGHAGLVMAIREQAGAIIHTSNLYYTEPQAVLAEKLCQNSFADRVFFGNSGAEANEAMIKAARLYGNEKGRYKIITAENSFHGRTMATISATGQDKVKKGYNPLLAGFSHVPYGNAEAIEGVVDDETVGVLLEPVQGEGGVVNPPAGYLNQVEKICRKRDLLFMLDEVQTGIGRLGRLFGYELSGVTPDGISLAKGLGGGIPIGAFLGNRKMTERFTAGTHGSTFGGNLLSAAAANVGMETVSDPAFLQNIRARSAQLVKGLEKLVGSGKVRGEGLLLGFEDGKGRGGEFVDKAEENGLLVTCVQGKYIRLTPPLILNEDDADEALDILDKTLSG